MPGIHHVMARSIKDIFCRFQTQNGKQVFRKAGWDTHGLPIELGVEKELGITKEDIGKKISVEDYNKACREAVMRYTDAWNKLTEKNWLLGRFGESIYYLRTKIYGNCMVVIKATLQ